MTTPLIRPTGALSIGGRQMPNIKVDVRGSDKENVKSATLGDKRWGENGQPYSTPQAVSAGNKTVTVSFAPSGSKGVAIDIPDVTGTRTLKLTVNSKTDVTAEIAEAVEGARRA
jgi:hypothetical protein